jgi:uncharacterized repeat protein (TIGR03803 family)
VSQEVAQRSSTTRRALLGHSAWLLGGCALGWRPFDALAQGSGLSRLAAAPGYGPLQPVADQTTGLPLLLLPAGFEYRSFGWVGEPLRDGWPTPPAHDGMAAFAVGNRIRLVRNHEISGLLGVPPLGGITYDIAAGGGTTTLELDASSGRVLRAWPSLAGTVRNCAGGPTPWNSWLSCEETLDDPSSVSRLRRKHGYVFEVPAEGTATGQPLTALGRMKHEAVAVDPESGFVYETEDEGEAGFYRFQPTTRADLALGGELYMLGVESRPGYDTRTGQTPLVELPVVWVRVPNPDPADAAERGVFRQGLQGGGAIFSRLEGIWYGDGLFYFTSTTGGNVGLGQVWRYNPDSERLVLLYESPGRDELKNPDNIAVSPQGSLLLCEDSDAPTRVQGLTAAGEIFPFAQNNLVLEDLGSAYLVRVLEAYFGIRVPAGASRTLLRLLLRALGNPRADFRDEEFAGACFGPGGWLFFNIQSPGISFAVRGPFAQGPL